MCIFSNLEALSDFLFNKFLFLVIFYHGLTSSIFLNTADPDAKGLEKTANTLLIPTQYLFAGKVAIYDPTTTSWKFEQRFSYQRFFFFKTFSSIIALPFSLTLGSFCKTLALVATDYKYKHQQLTEALHNTKIQSQNNLYQTLGMNILDPEQMQTYTPSIHQRRPGDELYMAEEKQALENIAKLLNSEKIVWWVDCGTCLGAHRYAGVIPWDLDIDIAILKPDFDNVLAILKKLDPQKYEIQDWSGRDFPKTYLKVLIKSTKSYIDIYHYQIHQEDQTIQYILSLEKNLFLPKGWKIRESRFKEPIAMNKVFPLKRAYFDGIEIFVPHDPITYLQRFYGQDLSPAKVYNPETCQYEKDLNHPYWQRSFAH